jgi:cbb3-type cytochrome oxidase subunit 3
MEHRRVTNFLLLVIAICLLLIVVKLYNAQWRRVAVDSGGHLLLSNRP